MGRSKSSVTDSVLQPLICPDKVTLKWLWDNLEAKVWWTLAGALVTSVGVGFAVGRLLPIAEAPKPIPGPIPIPDAPKPLPSPLAPAVIVVTKANAKVNGTKICSFVETGSSNTEVLSTQPTYTAGINSGIYWTRATQMNGKNGVLLHVEVRNPGVGVGASDFVYQVKLYQHDAKTFSDPIPYQDC